MTRGALVMLLVLALLVPEAASAATSNGGVAAPSAATPSGGTVVAAPKPPKKHKRKHKKKKKKRPRPPAPAVPAGTHRFPLAGPFTWPGADGKFNAGRTGHIHQGFDLLAPKGTPIVAPYAGTVTFVAYQAGGAGYYVVLHSDYDYAFMHLAKGTTRVKVGQTVAAGARIGDVGQSGDASGPHLHFEVWKGPWQQGGTPIDPEPLLRSWL